MVAIDQPTVVLDAGLRVQAASSRFAGALGKSAGASCADRLHDAARAGSFADLLDVTRISRNRLVLMKERVDIHQVLQEVRQMCGHEIRQRGIQVTTALGATG